MLQGIFGKEVASLEAIGFYRYREGIFNFDVILCKEEDFSFLSKTPDYKESTFTKVSDTFYGIDEVGVEFYNEHKESIAKIEEVLKEVNAFYNQEGTIGSRNYDVMDNFYLVHKDLDFIVPKDKVEWLENVATTDHYAYIDDVKHYLNEANIPLLGKFTKPIENAFKPSDDVRLIVNPLPLSKDNFGYKAVIFIGSGFKGKLMFMTLTVKLHEVKESEIY